MVPQKNARKERTVPKFNGVPPIPWYSAGNGAQEAPRVQQSVPCSLSHKCGGNEPQSSPPISALCALSAGAGGNGL